MKFTLLKKIMWKHLCHSEYDIKEILDTYDAVSFDVFDTLITRDVYDPTEVYTYVEIVYSERKGRMAFPFKELRIKAEANARKNSNKEVTINDIYSELESLTGCNCKEYLEIEKEVEYRIIQPRRDVKPIYDYCIESGKKVLLISDMYLDDFLITKMLNKCGFTQWHNLYLSSMYGETKRSGSLFRLALEKESLKPNQMIHIGDSIKSDYIRARVNNIASILLENNRVCLFYDKSNSFSLDEKEIEVYKNLNAFIANRLRGNDDFLYCLGYSVLGPLLYSFSQWVDDVIENEKPETVAFMAREGSLLKKAYEYLYPSKMKNVKYLYSSRRSVAYTHLKNVKNMADVINTMPLKRNEDLQGILNLLRLDKKENIKMLENAGERMDEPISDIKTDLVFLFADDIHSEAKLQGQYLSEYLKQNSVHGDTLIIDIGWRGTTQHFLQRYVAENMPDSNIQIKGLYLGVLDDNKLKDFWDDPKRGYLFDSKNNTYIADMVAVSRMAIELLFMPSEGSTAYYKKDTNGKVIPQKDPCEFTAKNIDEIRMIQEASLDFVNDIQCLDLELFAGASSRVFGANYFKFGIKPTKKSMNFIEQFSYTESGQVYNYRTAPIWRYILHPRKLIKDFSNTAWKTGFMRGCFRFDLPYYKFLVYFRRRDQK